MARTRIIPVLLLEHGRLVKTVRFRKPTYVGDPINAVKIFNEKEVDEIMILDVSATKDGTAPDLRMISDIAGEAFMPVCYGGGVRTIEQVQTILKAGVEKIAVNTAAHEIPGLITEASRRFGSQSIVASIDVRRSLFGSRDVAIRGGSRRIGLDPETHARNLEQRGAGEILLTSVDRDGTWKGYDLDLISKVAAAVGVPVIANAGARNVDDFAAAVKAGASAVAAGSMFVFHGPHRAVLITFPDQGLLAGLATPACP